METTITPNPGPALERLAEKAAAVYELVCQTAFEDAYDCETSELTARCAGAHEETEAMRDAGLACQVAYLRNVLGAGQAHALLATL